MSYFAELKQNIVKSTNNSSVANLGALSTFTGTLELIDGTMGIMVSLNTDQNCTINVDQSPDGSNWDLTDSFNYILPPGRDNANGSGSFHVMGVSEYFRVRVTNNNPSVATTYFRLTTMMAPIMDPLPRSLDHEGNLITSVYGIFGDFFTSAIVDQSRGLKTVEPIRISGSTFYGSLEPGLWTTSLAGSGSVVVSNGAATISTGATSASSAKLYSVRQARFIFGSVNYVRLVMFMPSVTGASTRKWGAITANDGFFFQHNNSTGFGIGVRKGGSETIVSTGSFVGEIGSNYILDANFHAFEIYYLQSGAYYFIDGKRLHVITPTSLSLVNNMDFTVGMENVNGANTNNNQMISLGASIYRLGSPTTIPRYTNISTNTTTTIKSSSGNLHSILVNGSGGASNTTTVYDSATGSGTIIGTIHTGGSGFAISAFDFKGVQFNNGLTIVTASGAAPNLTILWE